MTARCVVLACLAACGPTHGRGPEPPPATAHKPALVVVAADAATLTRTTEVLADFAGGGLAAVAFAVDGAAPPELVRALRADAPLGLAMTEDGVVVRWAGVGDPAALATALDHLPGAARWSADGAELWRFASGAIAVHAGDRVAVATAGAASKREQTALEIASGELDVTAPPHPGGIAAEIDGALVVAAAMDNPGPTLTQVGVDLGRIRAVMTATPEVVSVDLEVTPKAGTLAAHMVAGTGGGPMLVPAAPLALATRITPDEAIAVLTELGPAKNIDVPSYLQAIGRGSSVVTGAIALAPGAITVRFSDVDTMQMMSQVLNAVVMDRDFDNNALALGGPGGDGAGIGVAIRPGDLVATPAWKIDPPVIDPIEDDNADVPWSMDYRDARKAFEVAQEKLAAALSAHKQAVDLARYRWGKIFEGSVSIRLGTTGETYRGHGEWHPKEGTIAKTIAAGRLEFNDLPGHLLDINARAADAVAARNHVLQIRAHDVQDWDNKKH